MINKYARVLRLSTEKGGQTNFIHAYYFLLKNYKINLIRHLSDSLRQKGCRACN